MNKGIECPPSVWDAIEQQGFCVVPTDGSIEGLKSVAQWFGAIQKHPKGDADGVVEINALKADPAENSDKFLRYRAFDSRELPPHSELAVIDGLGVIEDKVLRITPCSFLLIQCVHPAPEGGLSVLIDGQHIFADLTKDHPELIPLMTHPGTIWYCAGEHFSTKPLFEAIGPNRWQVRYRADLMFIDPRCSGLGDIIQQYFLDPKYRVEFRLEPNNVLIVDNFRMLHGRTEIFKYDPDRPRKVRKVLVWNPENPDLSFVPLQEGSIDKSNFHVFDRYSIADPESLKNHALTPPGIRLEA